MPRAFDIAIAVLALLVLSPVLLVAAIAIKLGSRGPVIYRQRRVGLGGAEFEMLKLRTMVLGSDPVGIGTAVTRDDPRVTARRPPPAPHLARRDPQPRSTSCAARWRSSGRGRRSRPRSTTTPRASTAATRSAPGSPAGPRSRAGPGSPGRSGSSSTSGTSTAAALGLDLRILAKTAWLLVTGHGLAPD